MSSVALAEYFSSPAYKASQTAYKEAIKAEIRLEENVQAHFVDYARNIRYLTALKSSARLTALYNNWKQAKERSRVALEALQATPEHKAAFKC